MDLAPARFFVHVDARHRFGHELAGQKGVGWVNTSQLGIAEEPFQPSLFADPKAASQIQRCIDDPPDPFHGAEKSHGSIHHHLLQ
jgi:hypothetical protein